MKKDIEELALAYKENPTPEATPVLEFGSADLICQLVSEGDGISFLPDYVTENAVRAGYDAYSLVKALKKEIDDDQERLKSRPLARIVNRAN